MAKLDPPRRPSLRLPSYDYSLVGGYFVTMCTERRIDRFGEVVDGEMRLNGAGRMVQQVWDELPQRFNHVLIDELMVMPNHIHGIVMIQEYRAGQGLGPIIGAFKSLTTHAYIVGVRQQGWPRFDGRLWQDNYFEHIIRSEAALEKIRAYIAGNPAAWEHDPEKLP